MAKKVLVGMSGGVDSAACVQSSIAPNFSSRLQSRRHAAAAPL